VADEPRSRLGRWALRARRAAGRLWFRLVVFNLLLVLVPLAGVFYFGLHELLGRYERELLAAQEQSMAQQGRVLAAAISESVARRARDAGVPSVELDGEGAAQILAGLEQRTTSRLRVWDRDGRVLADSSRLGPTRDELAASGGEEAAGDGAATGRAPQDHWLYRLGAAPFRWLRELRDAAAADDYRGGGADSDAAPSEVAAALAGRYGAAVRPTLGDQRSVTLHVAIPVRSGERVIGAAQASQSTYRILEDLRRVRLAFFEVFLGSIALAVVLSLLLGTTLSRPVRRLRSEAATLVDRRGRLRGTFSGSRQHDELGDLARALEALSRRIEGHVRFVEAFAADVSHEFKNPLTSIRAATEVLSEAEDPAERERLLATVEREIARLERLLTGVREVSLIDSRLEDEPAAPEDLGALLGALVEGVRLRAPEGVGLTLALPGETVTVRAAADRLAQVFENLLDNALGFAPVGSAVRVRLTVDPAADRAREGREAVVSVSDDGPGIPPEHLDRVFDRFFTYRPSQPSKTGREAAAGAIAPARHTGLGLSIVKAIVEGYGGSVRAGASRAGGARLEVRLPLSSSEPKPKPRSEQGPPDPDATHGPGTAS
jgi:two-component system, OmpR family, sensor histidine kinase ChvG